MLWPNIWNCLSRPPACNSICNDVFESIIAFLRMASPRPNASEIEVDPFRPRDLKVSIKWFFIQSENVDTLFYSTVFTRLFIHYNNSYRRWNGQQCPFNLVQSEADSTSFVCTTRSVVNLLVYASHFTFYHHITSPRQTIQFLNMTVGSWYSNGFQAGQ